MQSSVMVCIFSTPIPDELMSRSNAEANQTYWEIWLDCTESHPLSWAKPSLSLSAWNLMDTSYRSATIHFNISKPHQNIPKHNTEQETKPRSNKPWLQNGAWDGCNSPWSRCKWGSRMLSSRRSACPRRLSSSGWCKPGRGRPTSLCSGFALPFVTIETPGKEEIWVMNRLNRWEDGESSGYQTGAS